VSRLSRTCEAFDRQEQEQDNGVCTCMRLRSLQVHGGVCFPR